MKLVKMMGLAVCAAIAAMAFVGVSSAAAEGSVICHLDATTTSPCPSGSLPFTGEITGLGEGSDTFVSGFTTVECKGTMKGTIESAGSSTTFASGKITSVTWSECKNSVGCNTTTAAAENLPWSITALGVSETEGVLHVSNVQGSFTLGGGGGACIFGSIKCIYGATTVLPVTLNHTATTPALIHATKLELLRKAGSSGSCSEKGTWTALYKLDPEDLSIFKL